MNDLIYDRTQADVTNKTSKGYYNTSDLNRVEEWCRYLADELNNAGYNINITTKTNWTSSDLRTASDMERIRNNIRALMNGYHFDTKIYSNANQFNYVKANNWEKILYEIWQFMWGMEDWYVYSGVANGGQNRLWQHRFREFYESPLTPQYTLLTYLTSTGTQYIDTGFSPTSSTKVEIKISSLPKTKWWNCVFGSRTSGGASDEFSFFRTSDALYRSDFAGNRVTFPNGTDLTNETVIIKDGNKTTINGTTITNTDATFTSQQTLYLFACNNGGEAVNEASYRFFYCKIWDNDILVRNFIPVIDSDNVVCLYDLVTSQYYYNQGQGKLVAEETTEYEVLNYIESTGTQYIDTGVTTVNAYSVKAFGYNTFGLTYSGIAYGNSMLGARVSSTNSNFQYANGAYSEFIGAGTSQLSLNRNTNREFLYLIYAKNNYQIYCGDYFEYGNITVSISTALNIHLFGLNNNGTNAGGTWKITNVNIFNSSNELIRQFVPVLRKSDNVPCMYDLINDVFYTNAGTGNFLYG